MKYFIIALIAGTTLFNGLSVLAGKPPPENLLKNGGSESPLLEGVDASRLNPDEWQVYASPQGVFEKIGISADTAKSGEQSMMFSTVGKPDAIQGVWLQVPIEEREKYYFIIYVKNDQESPLSGNSYAEMSVEWKDAEGIEVGRATGPKWNRSLSKKSWKRQRMIITAPRNAVIARLVITLCDGSSPEEGGTFYADDIEFYKK